LPERSEMDGWMGCVPPRRRTCKDTLGKARQPPVLQGKLGWHWWLGKAAATGSTGLQRKPALLLTNFF
jgi:hypothetical protein